MKNPAAWRGFYFITEARLSVHGVPNDVSQALEAGAVMVQYRDKVMDYPGRLAEAKDLLRLCRAADVPFIINDDVELARAVGADGVHLGNEDMPLSEARRILGYTAIIGCSVGTGEEAAKAESLGADYVAASPVFVTPTKPDAGQPTGIEGLRGIRAATRLPLAAIGGICEKSIREAAAAGADLICAVSAAYAHGAVKENILRMMRAFS